MKAEIISIGDELLIGQVVNTNASWMAEQLSLYGVSVGQITVIADQKDHIMRTLEEASRRSELVLITGGLGPTSDDITKHTLCTYFDTRLVLDPEALADIEALFPRRGLKVSEPNRLQAELPENCRSIPNAHGTARGMWFEKDGVIYISMPGVPFEMKPMMTNYILPELAGRNTTGTIYFKTVLTQGVGESFLAELIREWELQLPSNIKLAYLPQPGIVRLRLTATGPSLHHLKEEVDDEIRKLGSIIPELIFGFNDDTLEALVGSILKERGQTLVTAESCTGGYLAHRITSVPGSSAYYLGSIISYSNKLKMNLLGVPEEDLIRHGAVSEEVVKAMARGARIRLSADYAIAVSGIAGPDGGTAEKPVGTTWIAVASPEGVQAQKYQFGEHRERNITRTALTALNLLRKTLINK